ncbi:tyrosine-type recombinase/integrase [Amphritea sp. HPY]|uniref:tyrosine-type recombinase/integrase n=1 Tax=Amphritea sp. HPY TaxID=3421652 RepID=UPI003D7DB05C
MSKKKDNLTKALIESATYDPEGPSVQYIWDGKLAGFGVRLYPSGKKSYVVGYRPEGNPRMKFSRIGKVDVLAVEKARGIARSILANKSDPIQERQQAKAEAAHQKLQMARKPSMRRLIEEYYNHHEKRQMAAEKGKGGKHLSKDTLKQYRWTIEKHIRPYWTDALVTDIQRVDVRTFIRGISNKHGDKVANNVLQRLKALMRFALDEEYIGQNPCTDVSTDYQYIPVERTLSEAEIRCFWFGLEKTSIPPLVQLALKLLLVTAQRRSEIVTARWDWIDWDQKTLTIPRASVKNRKGSNIVPLSSLAICTLEKMKELSAGSPYLVPAPRNPNNHIAPQTVTNLLRRDFDKLGIDQDKGFTPHDLRRTVATMLSNEEVRREDIKAVLNHSFGDVTEVYINSGYIKQKRRYLDQWATTLENILENEDKVSNVVPINKH